MVDAPLPRETPLSPTPVSPAPHEAVDGPRKRSPAVAVGRGLIGRCPNCGRGAMFRAYLSVNPRCPACGEDLSGHRADDAPAFLTLLVACFVGGLGVLLSDDASSQMPLLAVALLAGCDRGRRLAGSAATEGRGRRLSMGPAPARFRAAANRSGLTARP